MDKIWRNRKELTQEEIFSTAEKYNIRPEVAAILLKRDIDIESYLDSQIYDGLLMKGIPEGAALIEAHTQKGNLICIVNDYDVDGITSGTIMAETIEYLGGKAVILTPDREIDGYGISNRIINMAINSGAKLIVTTDNGIAAVDEIQYVKDCGLDVVITDHHQIPFTEENGEITYIIPNADVVINPHQPGCPYPMKEICGAEVALKLCEVLLDRATTNKEPKELQDFKNSLMELAAIGTVCDVMPLIDENRTIVKKGINLLKQTHFRGIRYLLKLMNVEITNLTAFNIGFHIGPALNSASRMTGSAELGVMLLREKDDEKLIKIAEELYQLNNERKAENDVCQETALSKIEKHLDRVIILYLPNERPSLLGIVAGRIKEITGHPCVILTDTPGGILKGSGRSVEGYDMFHYFSKHKDLYEKFGGHEGAIGISIPKDNLPAVIKAINEDAAELPEELFQIKKDVDLFMDVRRVSIPLVYAISRMAPFGEGNVDPLFCAKGITPERVFTMGQDGMYCKLMFKKSDGQFIYAIAFKNASGLKELLGTDPAHYPKLDLLYKVSLNTYQGNTTAQATIEDYRIAA